MTQMLGALGHAHERGVIHRDLKLANMFLLEDGSLKVVDFGLARIDDSDLTALTKTGTVMGTPAYMSPEQVNALPVDHRTDLRHLDLARYEHAARAMDEIGSMVGGWRKAHDAAAGAISCLSSFRGR